MLHFLLMFYNIKSNSLLKRKEIYNVSKVPIRTIKMKENTSLVIHAVISVIINNVEQGLSFIGRALGLLVMKNLQLRLSVLIYN